MLKIQKEKYPYRKGVLGIIIDKNKKFLIINKQNYQENEWSFPGGGIEKGETLKEAIKRELQEELGTSNFEIIAESETPYIYEWPDETIIKRYQEKQELYRGQEVHYFLVKFTGENKDIKLEEEEIRKIRWVLLNELPAYLIFPGQWQSAKTHIEELLR